MKIVRSLVLRCDFARLVRMEQVSWRRLDLDAVPGGELAAWRAMTAAQSPLADLAWARTFVRAFGAGDARTGRPALHALYDGDRPIAALPLVRATGPARALVSLDNEHNPYWLAAGALDRETAELLLDRALDGADYLFLRRLPLDGPVARALTAAAEARGLNTSVIPSEHGDARLALDRPWPELWSRLPSNLRRDLPRKQRQLERRRGGLELVTLRTPGPTLDAALDACFELEARGWKGEHGSPIQRDPKTLVFYRELARELAEAGRFALYLLRCAGQLVAFEYCLRGGGHIEMLKLSYDPELATQSPGHVLRVLLLQDELARGEVAYYHFGRPSPWKLRWASEVAPLGTLRIYGRTVRAHAAWLLGPVLRGRLKRSALVQRLRRRSNDGRRMDEGRPGLGAE